VVSQLARNTVCFQLVVGQKNWAAQEVAIFRHIAANFGQRKVWVLKILLLPFGFYKKRILVPNFSLFGRFNDNFTTAKKFGCGQLPPLLALPQVSVCLQVEWTFHRRRWRMSGSHALTGARSADWLIDRSIDLSLTDRPDTCCTAPSPLELGCIKARIERNKWTKLKQQNYVPVDIGFSSPVVPVSFKCFFVDLCFFKFRQFFRCLFFMFCAHVVSKKIHLLTCLLSACSSVWSTWMGTGSS